MKIYFLNGDRAGQTMELTPPGISIGRETDNDVQLLVGGVSRYHSKIEFVNGEWGIRDLGSTNGTKVNGQILGAFRQLQPGDIIIMGDQSVRFGEKTPSIIAPAASLPPTPATHLPSVQPPPAVSPPPGSMFKTPASFQQNSRIEGDIFSKPKDPSAQTSEIGQRKGNLLGGSLGNTVFYVAVVGAAIIFMSIFIIMQKEPKASAANGNSNQGSETAHSQPFLLVYEKQKTNKDNIFKFTLLVENGSAAFSLDDLKYNRHFYKSFGKVNENFLKELESSVKKTEFIKLEQDSPAHGENGNDEYRMIIVGYGNNLKKVAVRNTYAPSSFEEVERAVEKFADDYGLRTVSIPVEEMKEEAQKALVKAESLFDNYLANPGNLREAILRYQLALDYLDQFEPKPKEWDIARKRLQEAQSILDRRIKDAKFAIDRMYNLKQYKEAVTECQNLMDMLDPDSILYKKIREYKIGFEQKSRGSK